MSGNKGMKMYPLGIRENILIEHKNGVSQCELSRKYVINNKNGAIYNITIDIAKTNDGRTILYATDGKIIEDELPSANIIAVMGSKPLTNPSSTNNITQHDTSVKHDNAESPYKGKHLNC